MKKNNQNTVKSDINNNQPNSRSKSGPGTGIRMVDSKNKRSFKENSHIIKKLFKYIGNYKITVYFGLFLAAISSILMLLGPNQVGRMTDLIKNGLSGNMDLNAIKQIGIILIVIYSGSAILSFIQHFLLAGVTAKICRRIRKEFAEKINLVPQSYYNTHLQGDILSCITNDVQTLRQGLSRSLPTLIRSIAQIVTCIIMMFATEWHLTLIILLVVLISFIAIFLIMNKSQKYFDNRQENLGNLNGYIEEMYSGYQIIRVSNAKKLIIDKFNQRNKKLYKTEYMSQFLSGIMAPLMMIISNITLLLVVVFGAILVFTGQIQFGVIAAFMLFNNFFTSPLMRIVQSLTDVQSIGAACVRIFDFLETEELPDESHKDIYIEKPKGNIVFEHVYFSYPNNPNKIIINDFNATIKAGQKVAIVGKTGAGKTTLVNLIMRFFELNSGRITIDGINHADLTRENIHNLFGMVLQDTWLFEGTIKENLIYNLNDISEDKLIKICRICAIYDLISNMPKGFDTVVTDSLAISLGQKQLFTIARAMLQNSPMFILDEATSSIDTKTELDIQLAMDELTHGRTCFVIAHRLSTIKNANLILVVEDGDVVECGTHNELLKQKSTYYDLYNSQFENN